jgi:hypothetical protein
VPHPFLGGHGFPLRAGPLVGHGEALQRLQRLRGNLLTLGQPARKGRHQLPSTRCRHRTRPIPKPRFCSDMEESPQPKSDSSGDSNAVTSVRVRGGRSAPWQPRERPLGVPCWLLLISGLGFVPLGLASADRPAVPAKPRPLLGGTAHDGLRDSRRGRRLCTASGTGYELGCPAFPRDQ